VSKKQQKEEEQISDKKTEEELAKNEEFAQMAEELAVQKDKYVRLMAEFDNFKKRTAGEYAKMSEQANKNLIDDLIEIRETLQKALSAEEGSGAFKEGVALIFSKFDEILAKHGLESFGETGDDFDPSLHDAMMKQASDEIEAGKIAVIFQKGYKLKNSIIRHAKVVISAGKEN
jgi:molecular chaperone GrpE